MTSINGVKMNKNKSYHWCGDCCSNWVWEPKIQYWTYESPKSEKTRISWKRCPKCNKKLEEARDC